MTDVLATLRCPQCSALVRTGQGWCTLCHADLRPDPVPDAAEPDHTELADTELADTEPADTEVQAAPAGRHARHAAPDRAAPAPESAAAGARTGANLEDVDVEGMLAELARQSGDPLGGVSRQLGSRFAKVGLAIGLGVGLTVLLLVGSLVLGALLD